jgi:pyruvate dehydrogenase E1 component alpha subunit
MKSAGELIAFESGIKDLWEAGELPFLIHLCGGNEGQLINIFRDVQKGDWIFSSHRSHYHYLLAGGSEEKLKDMILRGRSMFVFDKELNFLTSSVLAGTCCIAAGVAWSLKEEGSRASVWCFLGDGAEEQGHFYEAVQFVQGNKLPCKFIIEDNDRSVDTSKAQRRGDFEMKWPSCVIRYHYTPTYPHAGSGCKHHITFKT